MPRNRDLSRSSALVPSATGAPVRDDLGEGLSDENPGLAIPPDAFTYIMTQGPIVPGLVPGGVRDRAPEQLTFPFAEQ